MKKVFGLYEKRHDGAFHLVEGAEDIVDLIGRASQLILEGKVISIGQAEDTDLPMLPGRFETKQLKSKPMFKVAAAFSEN